MAAQQQKLPNFARTRQTFRQWVYSSEAILIASSIFVGILTAFGAIIFIWLLAQINGVVVWLGNNLGDVTGLFLAMISAGIIVGWMVNRWAKEAKGHGVPEVMEAVALRRGAIRGRVAAIKVLASSLTIGTGGSAGREGPIVQVGSALGSKVGQLLNLSSDRVQTLVACGAAAGIAATFNAPIAGSIFALEVILGRFTVRYFGTVVMSAVSASIISRIFLSDQPAFLVPAYPLNHLGEIPIYIVLGGLAALLAVLFIRVLYRAEAIFDGWSAPAWLKTAVGMLLTALVALLLPERQVLGSGLHFIGEAIAENVNLSFGLLIALLVLKLLATSFTLGAGNSGGVFAPALFMGATLGGIVGQLAHTFWPTVAKDPGAYAIVGMAAVFAGAARAPITAVLIVFEMSGDYKLILPLMLATVLATLLAEAIFTQSIYTLKLKLKGIRLQSGRDEDILQAVLVSEVMQQQDQTVRKNDSIASLIDTLAATHLHGLAVLDEEEQLWGIVTVNDIQRSNPDLHPKIVADIATPRHELLVAYPDETIGDALKRMATRALGHLPVIAPNKPNHLLGIVRRETIIRAYDVALARRAELQHRTQRLQLRNLDGTEFLDIKLAAHDRAVGKTILTLAPDLPKDCVLISIRRQGNVLIPHGDTTLVAGDEITAFVREQDTGLLLQSLCG